MENDINKKITIDVEVTTDGQQQINQYKTAFDSLRTSVANLSNPLSTLSSTISSLDKDLSKLTGSIDTLNKKNQDTSTIGTKVKGTITDLMSSFNSWNGIIKTVKGAVTGLGESAAALEAELSAGLSVLLTLLPTIIDWVSDIFKADTTLSALNKKLKDNKLVMEGINEARLQGLQNAQEELVHLQTLYDATQNNNISTSERLRLIRELKDEYPQYFSNISDEIILTGKAKETYYQLRDSILAVAQAKAAEEMIVTNTKRQLSNSIRASDIKAQMKENELALSEAQKKHNELENQTQGLTGHDSMPRSINGDDFDKLNEEKQKLQKEYGDILTDSNILRKRNNGLSDIITKSFIEEGKVLDSLKKEAKTTNHTTDSLREQVTFYKTKSENAGNQSTQGKESVDQRGPAIDVETPEPSINLEPSFSPGVITSSNLRAAFDKAQADAEEKAKEEALKKVEEKAKQSAKNIANDGFKTLTESIKQQEAAKIAALEKDKSSELANKSLTSAQRLAIENKYQKQEAPVKAKAFKQEQELSIAQAIINGAQAVTKVTAQAGVLAPFEIGIVVAETAAQIAKIAAQKPPAMAKGGHFKSDGKGAVLSGYSRTDDTNAFLRSGEAVVVSEAMQVPWARNLVSAINVGFGGRDFSVPNTTRGYAVGGIFTDGGNANRYYSAPVNDQKNLANTIAYQMINNFPPVYVDVKDINNQQNILAQTINRVNL